MSASYRSGLRLLAAAVTFAAAAVWCTHHALSLAGLTRGQGSRYTPVYALMFAVLVWQWLLAYTERPARTTARRARNLDAQVVAGIVPAYNEDPAALHACVMSMLEQTRLPQIVVVIDDGSTNGTYADIKRDLIHAAETAGVRLVWTRQRNAGKRHAQVAAVRLVPEATVFWTVDSDTISDPHALDELLTPLADPKVMSVAGIVLAQNVRRSFLTRFTDLLFVTGQLLDRSSLSRLRSVWVNSGPIAVYRAEILRDNTDGYLGETFRGRPVPFSDDSYLTLCALMAGYTVQQPTAFCFSLMPETFGNHRRQFDRWMRGSFIRSIWRFRYLKMTRLAYWLHLARWAQTVSATVMTGVIAWAAATGGVRWEAAAWLAGVPVAVGYANSLRYLVVRRSDQTLAYQIGTWLLAPVATFWQMTMLRGIRWWAIYRVLTSRQRLRWGTRTEVEVALAA